MKYISALLLALLLATTLQAQPQGKGKDDGDGQSDRKEQIESMKIAFLTKKLELTPDEAKNFWPVYNQYTAEMEKVRDARRKQHQEMRQNKENLSDKEYEKSIDTEILYRQQELDIMKKYTAQYKQVLPMKKVAALYRAEEDFKRELLEKMRERSQGQGGQHQGGQGGQHQGQGKRQ